jgi:hypothetical protein
MIEGHSHPPKKNDIADHPSFGPEDFKEEAESLAAT